MQSGANALRRAHFYRKLPQELTDGTSLGGMVSLLGIFVSMTLVYSITCTYLTTSLKTALVLDLQTEEFVDLAFNITLERLPCRFSSIDLFDETGTKRLNITQDLTKIRISSSDGHWLSAAEEEVWTDEPDPGGGEAPDFEYFSGEDPKPWPPMKALNEKAKFEAFVNGRDLVMVAFGAPWCPYSKRLNPIWQGLYDAVQADAIISGVVDIATVDCTVAEARELCQEQQIHAFPTMRIYRSHNSHSHEEYQGGRTAEDLYQFVQEAVEMGDMDLGWHPLTHLTHISGEGCQLSGYVRISRVPGSLRISAQSSLHSFDPLNMNVTHHVDRLLFLSPKAEVDARLQAHDPFDQRGIGELSLRRTTFVMHEQATTLKHFLKVVPTRRNQLDGDGLDTYEYSANFNEYLPPKLRPHALDEQHRLVPNTVFSYDISPYRVVHTESAQSLTTYLTQLCAVVGGVFTVFGLIDGALYNGIKAIKKD